MISIQKKFKEEVLAHGAEACLPVNLSDDWIRAIDNELNAYIIPSDIVDIHSNEMYIALSAVVAIVNAKNGGGSLFSAILADLFKKLKQYHTEIALEIFRRHTKTKYDPATLDNIFTNRNLGCMKL